MPQLLTLFRCILLSTHFESTKELGSASRGIKTLVELDSLLGNSDGT